MEAEDGKSHRGRSGELSSELECRYQCYTDDTKLWVVSEARSHLGSKRRGPETNEVRA